jgi:FtsZ-binding cell division protein ZapB
VDEKRNALQAQVDSQKAECNEKLAALKAHNEQITHAKINFQETVKIILQDNCNLR